MAVWRRFEVVVDAFAELERSIYWDVPVVTVGVIAGKATSKTIAEAGDNSRGRLRECAFIRGVLLGEELGNLRITGGDNRSNPPVNGYSLPIAPEFRRKIANDKGVAVRAQYRIFSRWFYC